MFGKHIVESRRKSTKDSFKLANNERARATTLVATRNESLPKNEKTENPVQKNKSVQVDSESSRDCNVASTKRSNVYL